MQKNRLIIDTNININEEIRRETINFVLEFDEIEETLYRKEKDIRFYILV